jgi:hypothetical protein
MSQLPEKRNATDRKEVEFIQTPGACLAIEYSRSIMQKYQLARCMDSQRKVVVTRALSDQYRQYIADINACTGIALMVDVYLSRLGKKIVEAALLALSDQGIDLEFEPAVTRKDPKTWSGFLPVAVSLRRFPGHTLLEDSFLTGFHIEVAAFEFDEHSPPLFSSETSAAILRTVRECCYIVRITCTDEEYGGGVIFDGFAAALANAGKGAAFDPVSGKFETHLQSVERFIESEDALLLTDLDMDDVRFFSAWQS